jgi:hypothetical protein
VAIANHSTPADTLIYRRRASMYLA